MIRLFAAAVALVLTFQPAAAFDTRATAAYVLDQTTGTVLLAKTRMSRCRLRRCPS